MLTSTPMNEKLNEVRHVPSEYTASSRFASPDVKTERLLVLTGGREPTALFTIQKANMSKTTFRDAKVIHLVDAIATDVGLFIISFAKYKAPNVGMATFAGGIAGGISEAVASKINSALASRKYDKARAAEIVSPKPVSETYAKRGEFLAADEITQLTQAPGNAIQFRCRGVQYTIAEKSIDVAMVQKWQADAALVRSGLTGGPPAAGIAGLIEWGQRPVADRPLWVEQAILRIASEELDEHDKRIIRDAGVRSTVKLTKKLREFSGGDAE